MPPPQPAPQTYPPAPLPMPLQPSSEAIYNHIGSSGSAPTLQSHSSSDSSVYALSTSFTNNGPQTPHLSHSHSDSSNHFRAASTPHHEKGDAFVNLSPAQQSPFGSTIGQSNAFWGGSIHPALSSQNPAGGSYGAAPDTMGYSDSLHHLPHVHETGSAAESSSDLRVMYPSMP